jgi:outer membrane murein-binding lipoprotein Lpp
MRTHLALAAIASLGLLAACEPDPADTGDEINNTAPTIDTTDSASEQLENEADAVREQAEKQAENIEARAEATAENIEESADKAAERLEAEAEKAK